MDSSLPSLQPMPVVAETAAEATEVASEVPGGDNAYSDPVTPAENALPNLTPYKPSGWSDKIVVSKQAGTTTDDSPLASTDTLYVDWAVANDGGAAASSTFYTYLYVDGALKASWYTSSLNSMYYAYVQDYNLGSLSTGSHTLQIITDATGVIGESNEGDNSYTRTITVGGQSQPNLTPYKPSGWSDKIVVSKQAGTTTDDSPLATTDTLYVDWAVANDGAAAASSTFYTYLYVDGALKASWYTSSLDSMYYTYVQDYNLGSLSAGSHTLQIVTDATGVIGESNEGDNSYTRTVTVGGQSQPNLTPYKPSGWSDKIVVSKGTGTTTDDSPLAPTDTLYVDWAVANDGGAAASSTFYTYLYVDGALKASWYTSSLDSTYYTYVQDYSLGSLSGGSHTLQVVTDATGVISESNEGDNSYTKTITVRDSNPTGQISGSKWNDENGNAVWDTGEPGLANWRIYLDANRNGEWETDETSVLTDSSGKYTFTGLAAGTYTVGEVLPEGWVQTCPGEAGGSSSVVVSESQATTDSSREDPWMQRLVVSEAAATSSLGGHQVAPGDGSAGLFVSLPDPVFTLVDTDDGFERIVAEGLEGSGEAGSPELPGRLLRFAVPPDTDLATVSLRLESSSTRQIAGTHRIAAAPLVATDAEDFEVVANVNTPGSGASDSQCCTVVSSQQMGRYKIVEVWYQPFAYDAESGILTVTEGVRISLDYQAGDPLPDAVLSNTVMAEAAEEILVNASSAERWYAAPAAGDARASATASFVIITTSAIQSGSTKLSSYVSQKEAKGFTVQVVTESTWGGGTGDTAADRIRSWLQANYAALGIQYVLLIGNPNPSSGNVPMKMTWPRSSASDSYRDSPTDYYYADLTSNWNADGDSMFGEWGGDLSSKPLREVLVGRIPVYGSSYADLDSILTKTIAYEQAADASWRKNILLPMAISNYANEDNGGGGRTDGVSLAEAIRSDIATPSGYDTYRLYEQAGRDPVTASCDAALTNANLVNEWSTTPYGVVDWWAHGSNTSAARKYWASDSDGDNVPDGGEMTWTDMFNSGNCSSLNNSYPSVVIQVSCLNGYPEDSSNLGYSLLKNGAIATVSGSRVTWYAVGTWSTGLSAYGDNASYAYSMTKRMVQNEQSETVGSALQWCRENFGTGFGAESWMNCTDFNVYGDPSIKLGASSPNVPYAYTVTLTDGQVVTGKNFGNQSTSSTTPPEASLAAGNVTTGGGTSYTFTVTFTDADDAVLVSTLDSSDVVVTGPGFSQGATFVSVDNPANGSPRTATYRITPPGGSWDAADNGTYAVSMQANQVSDTHGNFVVAGSLGSFSVNVEGYTIPPAASLTASNVTSSGGTSYTFTVTYTDSDDAVVVSSLDSSDVVLTGPAGFSQAAAFVSVDNSSNGSPRTATYRITPPGGSWDSADNGAYTVSMQANQVRDTHNNYVPAGSLGSFSVSVGARQIVSDTAQTVAATPGQPFSFPVKYTTSDNDNTLTGIGLRMHYNSAVMTYTSLSSVLSAGLVTQQSPANDTADYDGDPNTDKYILVGWADMGANWPNQSLPTQLYTANFALAAGVASGTQSAVRFSASSLAAGYAFESRAVSVVAATCNLDVDGNGASDALTDGILIMRYLFDPAGTWTVTGALGTGATRTTREQVKSFLDAGYSTMLDVDGNGSSDALTDGILAIRYLFDPSGTWTTAGALGTGATRTTPAQIKSFLNPYHVPVLSGSQRPSFGLPPEARSDGQEQVITATPQTLSIAPGKNGTFDLYYTTDPLDSTLTGLGVRIHYDSSLLTYNGLSNLFSAGLISQQEPADDTADYDGDPSTDKYVLLGWADATGNWPGEIPQRLATASFKLNASAAASTSVRFSGSSVAGGWSLNAAPVTISPKTGRDRTAPKAQLTAPNVATTGETSYTFTVAYSDNVAVMASTVDDSDIRVKGPNGFDQVATRVEVNPDADETLLTATYRISPPGDAWTAENSGTYTVSMQSKQVTDTSGNAVKSGKLGTFLVDTVAPQASLSASPIVKAGAKNYSFTVNYTDNLAVDVSTLDALDVRVLGPSGYDQAAALVRVSSRSDGPRRQATYRITPPNGQAWTAADSGAYTVVLQPDQVTDLVGTPVAAGTLGTFVVDPLAPTVSLAADNVVAEGGTLYTFTVTYADNLALERSTLDDFDVRVSGPKGYRQSATLVDSSLSIDGKQLAATYQITPPKGAWNAANNGVYTVSMQARQVTDTAGNPVPSGKLGTFSVDTVAPQASLSARNITKTGVTAYAFTVTYRDNIAVSTSTLDNLDIRVTGPNGYDQAATLVRVNKLSDGTLRKATYQITPPAGATWTSADNGTYTVIVQENQVLDTSGHALAEGQLGTFTVNLRAASATKPTSAISPSTSSADSLDSATLAALFATPAQRKTAGPQMVFASIEDWL